MTASSEVQIGLITDTHFWFGADSGFGEGERQLQPHSQLILDLLLADLQAQHLDLVLHLGDLTCGSGFGMPDPMVAEAIQKVKASLEAVGCPVCIVPGNHDYALDPSLPNTEELLGLTANQGTGHTFPQANLHIELIHTQGHTPAERAAAAQKAQTPVHGRVAPAELTRLEQALKAAAGLNVLVGCHQLLFPMSSWREPPAAQMQVANSSEVVQLLAQHGQVRAVFQGHTHAYDIHQAPLGPGFCTGVVVPALIMWPVSWLHLTVTPQELRWTLRPLPVPEQILARSKAQVQGDQKPGLPTWNPWRVGFPP